MQKVATNQSHLAVILRRRWRELLTDVYLKQGHVGAIVAVALVVVRVVDKGTVFLWDAITWGDRVNIVARLSWIVLKVLRGERIATFEQIHSHWQKTFIVHKWEVLVYVQCLPSLLNIANTAHTIHNVSIPMLLTIDFLVRCVAWTDWHETLVTQEWINRMVFACSQASMLYWGRGFHRRQSIIDYL